MRRSALALAAALGLSTCAEPDAPELGFYCAQVALCGCDIEVFATEAACNQRLRDGEARLRELAAESGLVFDPACWQTRLREVVDHLECASYLDPLVDSLPFTGCGVLHGDLAAGEPCRVYAIQLADLRPSPTAVEFTDCRAELRCVDGRCAAREPSVGLDEQCHFDGGDAQSWKPCAEGLACSALDVCAAPAGDGEPCGGGNLCRAGLDCAPADGTCRPAPSAGQPCTRTCGAGLLCEAGTCVAAGLPGEPCTDTDRCIDGSCDDGVCERNPAQLCVKAPENFFSPGF